MSTTKCNFKGCTSVIDGHTVRAVLFPVEYPVRCMEWIKAAENPDLLEISVKRLGNMGICHKHFEKSSYINISYLTLGRNAVPVKKLIRETFAFVPGKATPAAEKQNGQVNNNLDGKEEETLKNNVEKTNKNEQNEDNKDKEKIPAAEEQNGDAKNSLEEETNAEGTSPAAEEQNEQAKNNMEKKAEENVEKSNKNEQDEDSEHRETSPSAEESADNLEGPNTPEEDSQEIPDVVELRALDLQMKMLRRENNDLRNRLANHLALQEESSERHKPSKKSKAKKNAHSDHDKHVALRYFFRSPSLYAALIDDGVILPRLSTIREWLKVSHLRTGFSNKHFMQIIARIALNMNFKERQCVFSVQEVHVSKQIRYSEEMKMHEGNVDLGEFQQKGNVGAGNRAVLFAAHSLYTHWQLPVAYFISNGFIKNKIFKKMIQQAIQALTKVGLEINSIVCDLTEHKKALFKELHVNSNNPTFESEKRAISAVYAFPSVKRAICETIMHHPHLVVTSNLDEISWNDFCATIRVAIRRDYAYLFHSIANEHFTEVAFAEKDMFTENNAHHVFAVSQILGETKGIATALFLKKLTQLFKCLSEDTLPDGEEVLREAKSWLDDIQVDRSRIHCFEALSQTVEGILHVWDNNKFTFPILKMRNFTLEPITGLLQKVTEEAGAPEVAVDEFRAALERVISNRLQNWVY